METPQVEVKPETRPQGPRGVFSAKGAEEICENWDLKPLRVIVGPRRARVEGVRCVDREKNTVAEETWVINYTIVRINWVERWTLNHGLANVEIEWANARLTRLFSNVDVTLLEPERGD